METELRQPRPSLTDDTLLRAYVRENVHRFSFFQLVRLLERFHPERKPVGLFVAPAQEIARFSAHTSFVFPASEIQSYTEQTDAADRLTVNFMGLSTVNGPLPHPYVELLLERVRAKDHAAGEFFDIFNHRILSLFYRGWKKYRFYIAYEQNPSGIDAVTQAIYPLLGLGTGGLRGRMAIPDGAAIFYSGLLAQNRRSAQGLKQLLEDFFNVQVEVEQFTGSWKRLPAQDRTVLGEMQTDAERLGVAAVVGDEVWDQQGTVTVRLGPMALARYREFLPGGAAAVQLAEWLRFYAHNEFDFCVRLVLAREDVPGVLFSEREDEMTRLGFGSWLKLKPFQRDPEEAMYYL